jgi:hypothetical protein
MLEYPEHERAKALYARHLMLEGMAAEGFA